MGSGDLNMKKSWHPLLHTNQERVWKKEKEALDERKKLAELRKEQEQERIIHEMQKLQSEAGGKKFEQKVEWMYAAPAEGNGPNAEELEQYLLGKKRVDKLLRGNEEKLMAAPSSTAVGGSFTSIQNANTVKDTAAKIREDPLLAIKRQEQAQYEKILKNPKRLKELRAAREAGMTPAPGHHSSSSKEKKSKKDETKEERRARKEGKKDRERNDHHDVGGHKRRREHDDVSERDSRRPRSRSASPPPRRSHHDDRERERDDRRPRYDDRERERERDRDSDRRSYRDSDRAPPPPSFSHRDRSRSPPPPRNNRASPPDTKPTLSRSYPSEACSSSNYRRPPPPPSQSRAPPPTAEEIAARQAAIAARLEAMQSSASTISAERNARLAKMEAEDKAQLEKEAASRERERKGGVGPSFLRDQEKEVFAGGMDLGERMKRSGRIGMVGDKE